MAHLKNHPRPVLGGILACILVLVFYEHWTFSRSGDAANGINDAYYNSRYGSGPINFEGKNQNEAFDSTEVQKALEMVQLADLNGVVNNSYRSKNSGTYRFGWGKKSYARAFGSLENFKVKFDSLAGSHSYTKANMVDFWQRINSTSRESGELSQNTEKNINACILIHVRNLNQLSTLKRTMESVESHYNKEYHYPWVIVSHIELFEKKIIMQLRNIASGLIEFVHIKEPLTDQELLTRNSDAEAVTSLLDEFTAKREHRFEYYSKLQQLHIGKYFSDLLDKWELHTKKYSKLYDPYSISFSRLLSSDIFNLDAVTQYDYFVKLEPGTVFDGDVRYDIFERFTSDSNTNVGIVFMDKNLDSKISQSFNETLRSLQEKKNIKLSHYLIDDYNNYNGVIIDTETFLVGKTAFFNTKQYLSFVRFMDEMRLKFNEPWSASEIMTAYFAIVYSEATFKSAWDSEKELTVRKDLMVFDDLAVSDVGMFDSKLKNTLLGEIKPEKYLSTKQSCPISTSDINELLLRNVLNCNCDIDIRFFHSDVDSFTLLSNMTPESESSRVIVNETLFSEFHELMFAQTIKALSNNGADKELFVQFEEYFEAFPERQAKGFADIRVSRLEKEELLKAGQDKRTGDLLAERVKKFKKFIDDKRKNTDKELKELDEKMKTLENELKNEAEKRRKAEKEQKKKEEENQRRIQEEQQRTNQGSNSTIEVL